MPGYEYNLMGLNEFGDMFPRPRRSPWWPTTTNDYNSPQAKNYNLRENANDPYAGGNGIYSFLGHGELPFYHKQGALQLQNIHTVPKPPAFYEYEGFERVPFGFNLNCETAKCQPFNPYAETFYSFGPDYPNFYPHATCPMRLGYYFQSMWARTQYLTNNETREQVVNGFSSVYDPYTNISSEGEETWVEFGLTDTFKQLGPPPRDPAWPEPAQSVEELDGYSNYVEPERPSEENPPFPGANDGEVIGPGEGTGYGPWTRAWNPYWRKNQIFYTRLNRELMTNGVAHRIPRRDPYMNQPGQEYIERDFDPTKYEDDYRDKGGSYAGNKVWTSKYVGFDKFNNHVFPTTIVGDKNIYLENFETSYELTRNDQIPDRNDPASKTYYESKQWAHRWTDIQTTKVHLYEAGWSGDAQTPPMTGVWIQGTEDVGSVDGFEDRGNCPRVSISFFLGGRLIWEIADYNPENGFVDGYFPATNYHPDLDALQRTVGNTAGGIIPAGATMPLEEFSLFEFTDEKSHSGGGFDHQRRVGSHYTLRESLRHYPPQLMAMDWDATLPSFRELNYRFFDPYICEFGVGIYKDNTPWFNGAAWSHDGPGNAQPSRWDILSNPAATSGHNGSYGISLKGALMPRNHWFEDAIEHYLMQGAPSDFNMFSGVIIRNKVMQFFYQGQQIYVGSMKVYRNQDMYRVEDLNINDADRDWGYDPLSFENNPDLDLSLEKWGRRVVPKHTVPTRPDHTDHQFEKIKVTVGGKTRVFGVGRLVDFVSGYSLGTKHLCLNANGEIYGANPNSHYRNNNAVAGSADMRRIWVTQGPGADFTGYWTLHEYRTEAVMEGPGWDDRDKPSRIYRENIEVWKQRPAYLPNELPDLPYLVGEQLDGAPDSVKDDYPAHLRSIEAQNRAPDPVVPIDPELIGDWPGTGFSAPERDIRPRFEDIDPRLIEKKSEDDGEDYDWNKPCKNCTPRPEDI